MSEPLPKARPWSLTVRLVTLQLLATVVLIGGAFVALYLMISDHLEVDNRESLRNQVLVLAQWLGETTAHSEMTAPTQKDMARLLAIMPDLYVQVERLDGRVVLKSPQFDPGWLGAFPATGHRPVEWRAPDKRNFLLLAQTLEPPGTTPTHVLRVAYDVSDDDTLLRRLRQRMFIVSLLTLTVGGGLTLIIARGVFRPLARLTAATAGIHASQLNARVGGAHWPAEVAALAREYDAMLARLEDSFRRLARFSSDLSHELRTPINNLRGEAEVSLSRVRTAEEYRLVLESSLEECSRLSRLIDTLLFIARADNPEHGIQQRDLDAAAECRKLADFFEAMASERGVTLLVRGSARVHCDVELLRRALANLIDNAVRHTRSGGHIDLTVREAEGGATEIEVRDNGSGIPAEHLPRVFERFYRSEKNPGEAGAASGFGLGLAIVKSIMELHRGTVTLSSPPGAGTTATLHFPPAGK